MTHNRLTELCILFIKLHIGKTGLLLNGTFQTEVDELAKQPGVTQDDAMAFGVFFATQLTKEIFGPLQTEMGPLWDNFAEEAARILGISPDELK